MLLPANFEDVCMCDSVVDPDQCVVAVMEALFSQGPLLKSACCMLVFLRVMCVI